MRAVAVFGSSEPAEGDPLFRQAEHLGALLARSGYAVVTGGYGGVMEAASRGARRHGGRTIGVTCDIFANRTPNAHLDEVVRSTDLFDRTRKLVANSDGFVVLGGKTGTLAELSFLWALKRAGCLTRAPVILLGSTWRAVIDGLRAASMIDEAQLAVTVLVETAEQAVEVLGRTLSGR